MTRGGRTHDMTHWAAEPAGSTRSHPNRELETLFLLSFKRIPEPSCPTIKLSWQIYSVGFTDVFMNTDETAFNSTPASEYFPACLTLSNGTLPYTLGTFNCTQGLFTAAWVQENSLFPGCFALNFHVSLRQKKKKKIFLSNTGKDQIYWCNEHAAVSQELLNMSTIPLILKAFKKKRGRVEVWRKPVNLLYVWRFFTCGPRGRANGGPNNDEAAVTQHMLPKDKNINGHRRQKWVRELHHRVPRTLDASPPTRSEGKQVGPRDSSCWRGGGGVDIFPGLWWCSCCCCPSRRLGSSVCTIARSHWRCDI